MAWVRTAWSRGLFWYLGTDDIKFEAGVASESMITPAGTFHRCSALCG